MAMSWGEIVGAGAFLFNLERGFIEELALNETYVGSVGATSRSYRKIVMQRFCYGLPDTADDQQKFQQLVDRKVLIILLTSLALTKKRARVVRMMNAYSLTAQTEIDRQVARLAVDHIVTMPERSNDRAEKEGAVSLGATASCFPEVIVAFRCLIGSYSRDVVTIGGQPGGQEAFIPWAWACPEIAQLNWQPSCEQFMISVDRHFWENIVTWPAGTAAERKWSSTIFKNKFADKYGFRTPKDINTMLKWDHLGQLPATSQALGLTDPTQAAIQDRKRASFLSDAMESANKNLLKALFDEETLGWKPDESKGGPPPQPPKGGRGSGQEKRPKESSGGRGGGPGGAGGGAAPGGAGGGAATGGAGGGAAGSSGSGRLQPPGTTLTSLPPKAPPSASSQHSPGPVGESWKATKPKSAPTSLVPPGTMKRKGGMTLLEHSAAIGPALPKGNLGALAEAKLQQKHDVEVDSAAKDEEAPSTEEIAKSFPSLNWESSGAQTSKEPEEEVVLRSSDAKAQVEDEEEEAEEREFDMNVPDTDDEFDMGKSAITDEGMVMMNATDHRLCRVIDDYNYFPTSLCQTVNLSDGTVLGDDFMRFDNEDITDFQQAYSELSASIVNLDLIGKNFSASGWRECMQFLGKFSGFQKAELLLPMAMIQFHHDIYNFPDDLSASEKATLRGLVTTEHIDKENRPHIIDCIATGLIPDTSLLCEYRVLLRNRKDAENLDEKDKDAVFWLAWGHHMIKKYAARREFAQRKKDEDEFINVIQAYDAIARFKQVNNKKALTTREKRQKDGLIRKAEKIGVSWDSIGMKSPATYAELVMSIEP